MNSRRKLTIALGAGTLTALLAPLVQPQNQVGRAGFLALRWRPPEGYFADIPTLNHPTDVFTKIYGDPPRMWTTLFTHWTSGAVLRDYSALGAIAISGAGHESSLKAHNIQGTLVFEFSTLRWSYANGVITPNTANINLLVNEHGEYRDGSAFSGHTYLGLQELRASEGGGLKGSLVCFKGLAPEGIVPQSSHKMDVSQAIGGYSRFSSSPDGKLTGGTYPISVKDEKRGGFWLAIDTFGFKTRFISNAGKLEAELTTQNIWPAVNCGLALWPEKDLLLIIGGGDHSSPEANPRTTSIFIYDLANGYRQSIAPMHGIPPYSREGYYYAKEVDILSIVSGGAGYAVGDTITMTNGAGNEKTSAKIIVTVVNGNAITGFKYAPRTVTTGFVLDQRGWYKNPPPASISQASTSGSGRSAAFAVTWRAAEDYADTWNAGCHWCSYLNCIVGFDEKTQQIVTLTPPANYKVGDTAPWVWNHLTLKHWDEGDPKGEKIIRPADRLNGVFGRLRTVESLRAIVLFNMGPKSSLKPKIFTLPGMG